jgi:hypothetical protein
MTDQTPAPDLEASLASFQRRVNENSRLKKLTRGWTPHILIESVGSEASFTLVVRDGEITEVRRGRAEGAKNIEVRAAAPTLVDLFEGRLNPALAAADGQIEVYGPEADLVKLDAITLVLWG